MNVYPYSNAALENFARSIIRQFDAALLSSPAPVSIEAIMEKIFGLSIEFHHIRKNGRVLGETVFEDMMVAVYERRNGEGYKLIPVKAGTVIIDMSLMNNSSDGRFRFTCAHELFHYIKHKEYYITQGETAAMTKTSREASADKMLERQAERFASYLLMPKGTVKMAFYNHANNQRNTIKTLADFFKVSEQAMKYRLEELGLQA
ncbi:MAG: ImmA/IrrE family metallo-endopeptidase [Oscillospiraceae bacterium]|nr:ImmA/IrrE family metallo-endopeptidase [Oscillospiraceae bacterium]